jgi:hypothetical protein
VRIDPVNDGVPDKTEVTDRYDVDWKLLVGAPIFAGFALYNLYCALVYGTIIGSKTGNGWVTYATRPYSFCFAVIVSIGMVVIFGGGFIKIMLVRYGLLGRKPKAQDQPK